MKELPYFRFTPSEWQNGKISLEDYELQGFFIQVCCYYWISDCSITLAMLSKRYRYDKTLIEQCLNLGIFEHDIETDFITISFLNEQFDTLSEARKRRQYAGSQGGTKKGQNYSNAKAMLKQSHSYKDKDKYKDKDNIIEREKEKITPPETFNLDHLIQIEELETVLLDDYIWIENLARLYKFDTLNAENSMSIAREWVKKWVAEQKAENVKMKSKQDAFSHCKRWINTQLSKNGKTTTKDFNGNGGTGKNTGNTENLASKRPIRSAI